MKILFISPLPPPISGQSKVGGVILDNLVGHQTYIVDLGKAIEVTRFTNFFRAFYILKSLLKVFKHKNESDIIYLSLAESFLGNIRDLAVYFICWNKLDKVVIHMLGGTSMRVILKKNNFIGKLNRYFISKVGGVIVEGSLNYAAFSEVIDKKKIHIIPNFAEDYVFTTEDKINSKYEDVDKKINILYLSNLLPGKGYKELLDAFLMLDKNIRQKFSLTFVGGFENDDDKNLFLSKIKDQDDISYLGKFIDHGPKIILYEKSHIMCLPTYYLAEGLPIAILESFAAGIAVITTAHSGIPDVFKDRVNGYEVEKKKPESIVAILTAIANDPHQLKQYAMNNFLQAQSNHKVSKFKDAVINIFSDLK